MKLLILASAFAFFTCVPSFGAITHVTGGCSTKASSAAAGASFTFSCTPNAAGNAVLFSIGCSGNNITTATIAGTGWTFTSLTGLTGSNTAGWLAALGAITPNTSAVTFTVTFSASCANFMNVLADEFTGNDATGGTTTFDANNKATGSGACTVNVTPANANDAVWGACNDSVTAIGSGYTKGQDDTLSDWSEYKILSGGSGVAQTVNFTGTGNYTIVAATIKPSGGAVASPKTLTLLGVGD